MRNVKRWVVWETLNGERVRRVSGSYAYCQYVFVEMKRCGFDVSIEPDKD